MNLPAPKGWVVYIGADGADAIQDAAGYIWWADNIYIAGRKDETWRAAVMRTKNNLTEIIDLPESLDAAITLSWTPLGLRATSGRNGVTKTFIVPQFVQFGPTLTYADEQARQDASQALQEARRATIIAKEAYDMGKSAKSLSELLVKSQITIDQVWQKINDRLFLLIDAIERNDQSDPLNARWINVLFKKVNDWIYLWMKQHNKI